MNSNGITSNTAYKLNPAKRPKSSRFPTAPFEKEPERIPLEVMLNHNKGDVAFLVENKLILAHTHVLTRASSVFNAMFNGSFEEQKVIEITDCPELAFRLVLKGIYEQPTFFTLESVFIVMDCFLICHKYNISSLEAYLSQLLLKKIDASNAFKVLELSKYVPLPVVKSKCWSVIERQTYKAIVSDGFLEMDWNTLHDLLENNRLTVSEYSLACAVWNWTYHQKLNDPACKYKTLIGILGAAVYKLRFHLMTNVEFENICTKNMLTLVEILDLQKNSFPSQINYYSTIPRKNTCRCLRTKIKCCLCSTSWSPLLIKDPNNNLVLEPINENVADCECMKYLSCPNFPHGSTARILLEKTIKMKKKK